MDIRKLLVVLLCLVLFGCDEETQPQQQKQSPVVNSTDIYRSSADIHLATVRHDSHEYVVATVRSDTGGICLIHSPGCPCLKTPKVER